MFKNKSFRDKIAISGVTVLGIGVALLVFTFISAYGFLTESIIPLSSQDLAQTFGGALGPLIAASIHIMFLGVMGWVGSLVTIRGVTILTNAPKAEAGATQTPPVAEPKTQPQLQKEKVKPEAAKPEAKPEKEAKPEAKPAEPEMIVIPLEEMETQQPKQQEPKASS
jgi:hypothetical protein